MGAYRLLDLLFLLFFWGYFAASWLVIWFGEPWDAKKMSNME